MRVENSNNKINKELQKSTAIKQDQEQKRENSADNVLIAKDKLYQASQQ